MPAKTPAPVAEAPARVDPAQAIAVVLNRYKPVVRKLLEGTGTSDEQFIAQIANACRVTPKLWLCDPETVLGAALRSAQMGMAPNDGNNLCWIIPYKQTATWQLGYGGVMELARRAMPGLSFEGRTVYEGDIFELAFKGTETKIHHRPAATRRPPKPRGEAYLWYVIATYPDGRTIVHYLDRDGVEYHRGFSKQADGEMWTNSYDAAALKSVVLDMRRWLPVSRLLAEAVAADAQVHDVRDMADAGEIRHMPDRPTPIEVGEHVDPDDVADAEWVEQARGTSAGADTGMTSASDDPAPADPTDQEDTPT